MTVVIAQSIISGLLGGGVYALLAVGFTLILGSLNYVNFAHGVLVVMGMYLMYVAYQWTGISPFLLALPVAGVLLLVAALIYPIVVAPTVRKGHELQIVLTLLLMNLLTAVYEVVFQADLLSLKGAQGQWLIAVGDGKLGISTARLVSFAAVVVITLALQLFLQRTGHGKLIRACTANITGAQVIGVNVSGVSQLVFLLGTVCAGLAGALYMTYSVVDPYQGMDLTLVAFIVAVMAGLDLKRVVLSGLAFGVIEAVAGTLVSESFSRVTVYAIFVLLLMLNPGKIVSRGVVVR